MPKKNAIHSQQVYDPTDDSIMAEQELCMERRYDYIIGIEKSTGKRFNRRRPLYVRAFFQIANRNSF